MQLGIRAAIVCGACFIVTNGVGHPAHAAILVEIHRTANEGFGLYRAMLIDQLAEVGEPVLDAEQTTALWNTRVLTGADANADAAFLQQAVGNATGRNLFFENDFEAAGALLREGLEALQGDPSVLAFHPDLAPAAFDAALTLVRVYDALGLPESAEDSMEAAATLMWEAAPSDSEFSAGFIEDYEAVKSLMPTRAVDVSWDSGTHCRLRVNGFVAQLGERGGELRVPPGEHFLALECDDGRSAVHALDRRRTAIHIALEFDDAAALTESGIVLRPRQSDPRTLRNLAAQAARILGEDVVYTLANSAERGPDDAPMIELTRVEADGVVPFRAVRLVVGDLGTDGRMAAAVAYLVSGRTTSGVAIWSPEGGWTEPDGLVVVERRPRIGAWIVGGIALASAGAAIWAETRVAESLDDVDTCAEVPGGCDTMGALRGDARGARVLANTMWTVTGASAIGAVVLGAARRGSRDAAALPVFAVQPRRGGASALLRVTF